MALSDPYAVVGGSFIGCQGQATYLRDPRCLERYQGSRVGCDGGTTQRDGDPVFRSPAQAQLAVPRPYGLGCLRLAVPCWSPGPVGASPRGGLVVAGYL